jgi:hypothetical protein
MLWAYVQLEVALCLDMHAAAFSVQQGGQRSWCSVTHSQCAGPRWRPPPSHMRLKNGTTHVRRQHKDALLFGPRRPPVWPLSGAHAQRSPANVSSECGTVAAVDHRRGDTGAGCQGWTGSGTLLGTPGTLGAVMFRLNLPATRLAEPLRMGLDNRCTGGCVTWHLQSNACEPRSTYSRGRFCSSCHVTLHTGQLQ